MPVFVEVALPVPLRQHFSYRVKDEQQTGLQIGLRVKVPFGPQQLIGLITAITDSCNLAPHQIKSVTAVLDEAPLLPDSLYKLTLWAARYYFTSQGQMLSQALPVALRKGLEAAPQAVIEYHLTRTQCLLKRINTRPSTEKTV
jgi:primosomal protein N' (replication factor Y)